MKECNHGEKNSCVVGTSKFHQNSPGTTHQSQCHIRFEHRGKPIYVVGSILELDHHNEKMCVAETIYKCSLQLVTPAFQPRSTKLIGNS